MKKNKKFVKPRTKKIFRYQHGFVSPSALFFPATANMTAESRFFSIIVNYFRGSGRDGHKAGFRDAAGVRGGDDIFFYLG